MKATKILINFDFFLMTITYQQFSSLSVEGVQLLVLLYFVVAPLHHLNQFLNRICKFSVFFIPLKQIYDKSKFKLEFPLLKLVIH